MCHVVQSLRAPVYKQSGLFDGLQGNGRYSGKGLAHRDSDMLQKSSNLCSVKASFPWTWSPKVPLSIRRPAFPPCMYAVRVCES